MPTREKRFVTAPKGNFRDEVTILNEENLEKLRQMDPKYDDNHHVFQIKAEDKATWESYGPQRGTTESFRTVTFPTLDGVMGMGSDVRMIVSVIALCLSSFALGMTFQSWVTRDHRRNR